MGKRPHHETLNAIASADALVQSSYGIETQGMTAYEAACLGTPIIVSDPAIAHEITGGYSHSKVYITPDSQIASMTRTLNHFLAQRSVTTEIKAPYCSLTQSQLTTQMIDHYATLIAQRQPAMSAIQ